MSNDPNGDKDGEFPTPDSNIDHPEQFSVEKQMQKTYVKNKQILSNDLSGRLYAEVERLFLLMGYNIQPKYHRYLLNSHSTIEDVLLNIEGFLMNLTFFYEISKLNDMEQHKFADDQPTFQYWRSIYNQIYVNDLTNIECVVLHHVLKCVFLKRIYCLSPAISEKIKTNADRKSDADDLFRTRLNDAIKMKNLANHVSMITGDQLNSTTEEDLIFTEVPVFNYNPADLTYN